MHDYRQPEGCRVKGRRLPGGEIALYLSTKRSTLWDRLTGKAAERRELARTALYQVYKNERSALKSGGCFIHGHHKQALSTLLSSVGFVEAPKGHRLKKEWNARRCDRNPFSFSS